MFCDSWGVCRRPIRKQGQDGMTSCTLTKRREYLPMTRILPQNSNMKHVGMCSRLCQSSLWINQSRHREFKGPSTRTFLPRTTSTTPDPSPAVSNNSSKRSRPIGRKPAKRLAFDSDRAELNAAKLARYEAQTQAALMSAEKNKQLIEDMAEIKAMMRMGFNQTAGKTDFTTEK